MRVVLKRFLVGCCSHLPSRRRTGVVPHRPQRRGPRAIRVGPDADGEVGFRESGEESASGQLD